MNIGLNLLIILMILAPGLILFSRINSEMSGIVKPAEFRSNSYNVLAFAPVLSAFVHLAWNCLFVMNDTIVSSDWFKASNLPTLKFEHQVNAYNILATALKSKSIYDIPFFYVLFIYIVLLTLTFSFLLLLLFCRRVYATHTLKRWRGGDDDRDWLKFALKVNQLPDYSLMAKVHTKTHPLKNTNGGYVGPVRYVRLGEHERITSIELEKAELFKTTSREDTVIQEYPVESVIHLDQSNILSVSYFLFPDNYEARDPQGQVVTSAQSDSENYPRLIEDLENLIRAYETQHGPLEADEASQADA